MSDLILINSTIDLASTALKSFHTHSLPYHSHHQIKLIFETKQKKGGISYQYNSDKRCIKSQTIVTSNVIPEFEGEHILIAHACDVIEVVTDQF
jgi:hypothetical protein